MNKSGIKLIFGKLSILLILLFSFTDLNAADSSLQEKINNLKDKIEASQDNSDGQSFYTVLIMLPTKYNPDNEGNRKSVPLGDIQKTSIEILEKFDQCSTIDPFPKIGLWKRNGIINDIVEDVNVILELDKVTPKKKNELIKYCREVLLKRFQQEAIHVRIIPEKKSYEVIIVEKNH